MHARIQAREVAPVQHLLCLSKELNFGSDQKPDIAFWLFQV